MPLKIFHTADIHLGMKFNEYPASVQQKLQEARYEVLKTIAEKASAKNCNILVIAGDLFNTPKIEAKKVLKTVNLLDHFQGECILILPGNHDYAIGPENVWQTFARNRTKKMVLLDEFEPYDLQEYGLDVTVYPAPCDSRHSEDNNLDWIRELERNSDTKFSLGIAHGALAGLSPDITEAYFKMTREELKSLEMDLWLLGHTHIQYPETENPVNQKIFNSGTPEPDGLDCSHSGFSWYIKLDENHKTRAEKIATGKFSFHDIEYKITADQDLENIKKELLERNPTDKIVRLNLSGGISESLYQNMQSYYEELKNKLGYLKYEDDDLYINITQKTIDDRFTPGSFPHHLLTKLKDDEKTLHLAYEFIKEVQK